MGRLRLVLRSLAYHWRTGAVVAFGLAIATAVVTGALVTGDSVHGSLRDTGLARLGRIDHALVAPSFFRVELAEDLLRADGVSSVVERVSALLLTQGAVRNVDTDAVAPGVTVLGVDDGFRQLHGSADFPELSGRECAVNEAVARDLGLKQGDALILTAHRRRAVASDTLFARRGRRDVAPSMRLQVAHVLPTGGVGDFRLDTQTSAPRNLFLGREWLAQQLDLEGRANVLIAASAPSGRERSGELLTAGLEQVCTLRDQGLVVAANEEQAYVSVMSDAMLLTETQIVAAQAAAARCGAEAGVASVYLATRISRPEAPESRELAYAVVAGLRPVTGEEPVPGEGEAWLNTWAAEDLGCEVGEKLELDYLVPTDDGTYPTGSMELTLAHIVEVAGPCADRELAPNFEGMTDAESVSDWDPPFPMDLNRITDRDDEYWTRYRATPKAFVSLATVQAMWQSAPQGSNADWATSIRVAPPPGADLTEFRDAYAVALLAKLTPRASGLAFAPLRELTLEAAKGTSDFGQLFLGLSMFLVASGAGLAGMLLRLSVERRASEAGIMLACGCNEKLVSRVLFADGALQTVLGTLLGVPLGVLYAGGMIAALRTWWQGALGDTPSLWLHVESGSLAAGAACGLVVGLVVSWWSVRHLRRQRVLALLRGWQAMAFLPQVKRPWLAPVALVLSLAVACLLGVLAIFSESVPAAGAFFGIGWALLVAGLSAAALVLRRLRRSRGATRSIARLSLRNAAAASGRSLLTAGLLAGATFIVVATATNARDFSHLNVTERQSGTGGFALQAVSSVPLPYDLGTPEGRANLGFAPEDEKLFEGLEVISFLASRGEDISCLNLARPSVPRVLGVPEEMRERGGFSVMHEAVKVTNPWGLLWGDADEGSMPAFGDASSVKWSLHSGLGKMYPHPAGELRFVGLLPGSIFARELLVSEDNSRELFPGITSPSFFLVDVPSGQEQAVAEALRRNLGELGVEVRATGEVLDGFIRVQNTYLAMFLILGGLGLVLGTVGLGATLVRSAFERRRELALMSAVGHTRGAVAAMLLLENGGLLVAGLLWGTVSALVAVAPHIASPEAVVNWTALAGVLGSVLVIGLGTCLLAVRGVLRTELVPALRRE